MHIVKYILQFVEKSLNMFYNIKISKNPYIRKTTYITYSDCYDEYDSCNT